jgi:3',5'-cyclic AMP phosphodiesterase CpdA
MIRNKFLVSKLYSIYIISILCWGYSLYLYDDSVLSLSAKTSAIESPLTQPHQRYRSQLKMKDKPSNIMHYIQVSDLHISKYTPYGGKLHLGRFITNELPIVAPDLVFATGDLTDAKFPSQVNSMQHREEWMLYHNMLQSHGIFNRNNGRFWWDLRGNHDCFSVPSFSHSENMYQFLSAAKSEGYAFDWKKDFGTYSFIALDACPRVGASRPLNFFGYLDNNDMDFYAESLNRSVAQNHNHTFLMTHYPISYMMLGKTSDGIGFWEISQHVSLWLCGHLHKFIGGLGETMYTNHNPLLELELADMKKHGSFRIIVIDHDLVSFRDFTIDAPSLPIWNYHALYTKPAPPMVVITNPKDSRFILEDIEPVNRIIESSHIRVLIWSSIDIKKVTGFIDQTEILEKAVYNGVGKPWKNINDYSDKEAHLPLWTIPWDPSKYNDQKEHIMVVKAVDAANQTSNHTLVFRVDGKHSKMESGPGGVILSIPVGIIVKEFFIVSYIVLVVFCLLVPKSFVLITRASGKYQEWKEMTSQELISRDNASLVYLSRSQVNPRQIFNHITSDFMFTMKAHFLRMCELVNDASIFYPLYIFMLYMICFPLYVGDFVPTSGDIQNRWGYLYIHGIKMYSSEWVPVLDSWIVCM